LSYTTERRKEIGAEQGKVYRQKALDKYYANPSVCKNCGKIIEVPDGKKPGDIRIKKFCDHSCAARFNNLGIDRWSVKRELTENNEIISICEDCGIEIVNSPIPRKNRRYGFTHYIRKYCEDCVPEARIRNLKKTRRQKAIKNGITHTVLAKEETMPELIVNGITKGELKELTKDFGYYGWKAAITRHARRTYLASGQGMRCKVCGFNFHVHIAHIRGVSEFTDDDKISDINDLKNLVALCPNHHIMFDKKAIKI
jgi:hypothetical protein